MRVQLLTLSPEKTLNCGNPSPAWSRWEENTAGFKSGQMKMEVCKTWVSHLSSCIPTALFFKTNSRLMTFSVERSSEEAVRELDVAFYGFRFMTLIQYNPLKWEMKYAMITSPMSALCIQCFYISARLLLFRCCVAVEILVALTCTWISFALWCVTESVHYKIYFCRFFPCETISVCACMTLTLIKISLSLCVCWLQRNTPPPDTVST